MLLRNFLRKLARSFGALSALTLAALAPRVQAADWTVGANIGNVPWEFQDAQGQFVGFEVDLIREVARRSGKSVQVDNIPFNGLFAAVQSGRIQVALSSITITPKRLESLSFAQPYYDSDQSLTVLKPSKINALTDLSGAVVGVDTASTGDIWATAQTGPLRIGRIARYEGLAPAMLDLAAGRIDAYLSDLPAVEYYIRKKPQYRIALRIPTGERYSFMLAKGSPLLPGINATLTQMKNDGFLAKTHEKWFGSLPGPNSSTVKVMDVPKL